MSESITYESKKWVIDRRDSVGITNFLLGVVGFLEDVGIVSDWFLVDGGIFKIFPRSQNCQKNQLFFTILAGPIVPKRIENF